MEKEPRFQMLGMVLLMLTMFRVYAEAVLLAQGGTLDQMTRMAALAFVFCAWSLSMVMVPHFLRKGYPWLAVSPWLITGAAIDSLWFKHKSGVDRPGILAAVLIGLWLLQYVGLCQWHPALARIFAVYVYEAPRMTVSQVLPPYGQAYPAAPNEGK